MATCSKPLRALNAILLNRFTDASVNTGHAKVSGVSATGSQLFPRWFFPGNLYLRYSHRGYITNFDAFDAPWRVLAGYLDDLVVSREWPGERYLARGVLKPL